MKDNSRSILLVSEIFPPMIGGPATFVDHLAHGLSRQDFAVQVICSSAKAHDAGDSQRPFRVKRVALAPRKLFRVRAFVSIWMEALKADVMFANNLEYLVFRAAQLTGKTYVVKIVGDAAWETARNLGWTQSSIDDFQHCGQYPPQVQAMVDHRRAALESARLVITPSHYLKRMVEGWGVPPARIQVIPNGVDLFEYENLSPRQRTEPTLKVLYSGRLVNWKGVDTLITALQDAPHVTLTILGEGPELNHLKQMVAAMGMQARIVFHDRVFGADYRALLNRHDVLVLPSSYEGHPHVLLEGAAAGLMLVTTTSGGNPEVVEDGRNGLLFEYGDISALSTILTRLQRDEELRYGLAMAAWQEKTRHDFDVTMQAYIRALSGLMA